LKATLASPKSHILSLQSAFAKIFLGFRSLWNTFAVKKITMSQINCTDFFPRTGNCTDIHTNNKNKTKWCHLQKHFAFLLSAIYFYTTINFTASFVIQKFFVCTSWLVQLKYNFWRTFIWDKEMTIYLLLLQVTYFLCILK
jgi:hypothetical protein